MTRIFSRSLTLTTVALLAVACTSNNGDSSSSGSSSSGGGTSTSAGASSLANSSSRAGSSAAGSSSRAGSSAGSSSQAGSTSTPASTSTSATSTTASGSSSAGASSLGGGSSGSSGAGSSSTGASSSGAPVCTFVEHVTGVVASSPDLGTCCSGGFPVINDLSGLTPAGSFYGTHDCNDASQWSSQTLAPGVLRFDLQQEVFLEQLAIWNSGQSTGQRGVDAFTVDVSLDGVTFVPALGVQHLTRALTCPVTADIIAMTPVRARYVNFNITSSFNTGGVSDLGLAEVWFSGTTTCASGPVAGVTVTTTMGEFTPITTLVDGSGLSAPNPQGTFDCGDGTGWKSDVGTTSGAVVFDLGAPRALRRMAIWNHGQLNGNRGVNGVTFESSLDGVTFTAIPNLPTALKKVTACPATAQIIPVQPPVQTRYVRFSITSGHGGANTGLGEVMFFAE